MSEQYNEVRLHGMCSTVAVMEYIRDNGIATDRNTIFEFPDDMRGNGILKTPAMLVASHESERNIACFLDLHPVEQWHDVFGMKRTLCTDYSTREWYAYIDGKYYFIDA